MKRLDKILISLLALTSPAFADLCSDLTANYAQRMMQLQNDTNAALAQTTDPGEQAAIRQSFQMQLAMLQAEKDAALTSAGCNTPVPPPPTDPGTPPTDPGTPPTDPGTPPTDPGTGPNPPTDPGTPPTDPGTPPTDPGTPPTDPGTPPTNPGGANCPPNNCFQELKDYAEQLKCQGFRGRDLMDRVKMKANELGCGFGYGRGSNPHHGYNKPRGSNCRHNQQRNRCGQRRDRNRDCDD